jgi:hypothetical protein
MGCTKQIWRGGQLGSAWAILQAPSYDLWIEHVGQHFRPRDAEVWDEHERAISNFLDSAPTLYPKEVRSFR